MNARERLAATMHYQPRDRSPIMDFGFWDETLELWKKQGLPANAHPDDFFGMDPQWIEIPVRTGMFPVFEEKLIEDKGDKEIVRTSDGVTVERGKHLGSIPRHLGHTLKDRKSWEEHFKWRFEKNPERLPKNWNEIAAHYKDPNRDYPLGLFLGSLYGSIRDQMGLEALSLLVYDDRKLFEEIVETRATCIINSITPVLESGVKAEWTEFWEDMCYRSGPLLSPKIFKEVLVPQYQRITSLLKKYGMDVVVVDCDGFIEQLLPLFLEGGVNTMFPIEVGVWQADPVAYRKRWGKELLMWGGVDKRVLATTPEKISAEVERLAPLVEEGGYIPMVDHRVPADVPFLNYIHYVKEMKRVWGKNLPNVRPTKTPVIW